VTERKQSEREFERATMDWKNGDRYRLRRRTLLGTLGTLPLAGCQSTTESAAVEMDAPETALIDERFVPEITGLDGERVRLDTEAEVGIGAAVTEWSSTATFEVPADGTVSLAEQAPVAGDYASADPMGPVWSMTNDEPVADASFPGEDHELVFTAYVDGERVARTVVDRRYAATGVTGESLADDIEGTLYTPGGSDPAPAVILLHGSRAGEMTTHAKLLASRGYSALALKYFGSKNDNADMLSEVPVEYVQRAIDATLEHDRVGGEQVGLLGISKGAELALLAGSEYDSVGAVVAIAPSLYVWEGFDRNWDRTGESSWTIDGDPVPFLEYVPEEAVGDTDGFRRTYELGERRATESERQAATIPVEDIDGPVLLVSGTDDRVWHSTPMAEDITSRLTGADRDYADDHLSYEGAGHAILPPYLPTYGMNDSQAVALGGTPEANARANGDHWPAVLEHLTALEPGGTSVDPPETDPDVAPIRTGLPLAEVLLSLGGTILGTVALFALLSEYGRYLARWRRDETIGRREAIHRLLYSDRADGALFALTFALGFVFQQLGRTTLMAACWVVAALTVLWYSKDYTYERLEAYYDRKERERDDDGPDRTLTPHSIGRNPKMGFITTVVWLAIIIGMLGLVYLTTLL